MLRDWEDKFWDEVLSQFAAEPESGELRAERELWECTVRDGLDGRTRGGAVDRGATPGDPRP
jgi:hypothetical protein